MNFPLILAILLVVATNQFTESDAQAPPAAPPGAASPGPSMAPGSGHPGAAPAAASGAPAEANTSAKEPDTTTPKGTNGAIDLKSLGSLCLSLALIITIVNEF